MNTAWWRTLDELDDDQKAFILVPPDGRHVLVGPPGSGKTNLLLLRAEYMAGTGEKNVLILTYTNTLADFIRSGMGSRGLIRPDQIGTYHSWAATHVRDVLGPKVLSSGDFDDAKRAELLGLVQQANSRLPTTKMYSGIFVDEAQDLTLDELTSLSSLSDKICVCGDVKQGIYGKDGLSIESALGAQRHVLKRHFRIGQRIARVADRIFPPQTGEESLESTSNYSPAAQGDSSAEMHECPSRDVQFETMLGLIRIQLDAFHGDSIAVLCGRKETRAELHERFAKTDLAGLVATFGIDGDASFGGGKPITVMTAHSAKGAEFRAVHIFGGEDFSKFPLNRRTLSYTAVTRAKTALNVYRTGATNVALENAFSKPRPFGLTDLLPIGGKQ